LAGGKPISVGLKEFKKEETVEWILNEKELYNACTEKTKMSILNTPNNPTGKVFSKTELQTIAKFCIEKDLICLSDEVRIAFKLTL
jgi:aspartate/methionine/tyrosine aminotransferase